MAPLIALAGAFVVFRATGWAGVAYFDDWQMSLRAAVAVMFLVTASAHWGKRRSDLIRMVPAGVPRPDLAVSLTGYLEIAGAVALMIPALSAPAAIGLMAMLIAMFPANVKAAREQLTIGGRRVPSLPVRALLQVVFLGAVLLASPLPH
ncbi:DoxX family membrane protein [Xylanibacillus composti]|uniref:DoxX-like protein n=1 Tax=Xylanibacillus composti TaxID=1572762 RepID=A0A8J4H4H1_9BACL|nr:DoxX family protein [Xylanibacillus composti]MDT9724038.1 DoxX family membrane protein [Xylanibacillus composti]GIQ69431.1 hypothetical protein XYCOK13_22550 [Xylanibacillus composti]